MPRPAPTASFFGRVVGRDRAGLPLQRPSVDPPQAARATHGPAAPDLSGLSTARGTLPILDDWLDAQRREVHLLGILVGPRPGLVDTLLERRSCAVSTVGAVEANLVEERPESAAALAAAVREAGAPGLRILCADPGACSTYVGRSPADLVVLGRDLVDGPLHRLFGLVAGLPRLLAPRGSVLSHRPGDPEVASRLTGALGRAGLDTDGTQDGELTLHAFLGLHRPLDPTGRFWPREGQSRSPIVGP